MAAAAPARPAAKPVAGKPLAAKPDAGRLDATKPETAGAEAPPPRSRKKLLVVLGAAIAFIAVAGVGAWFFLKKPPEAARAATATAAAAAPASAETNKQRKAPIFVPFEPLVVNLRDEAIERMMQIAFSFEAADAKAGDAVKVHTPAIRNRLILLLTSKSSGELAGREGKEKLAKEILEEARAAMGATREAPVIEAVHFTSIIVQ